ncbi:MAG: hypothetical protein RIQ60_3485 [Pseudomonadota bacterium]
MDRLEWMKTFVAVVESGSFSAVARQLDCSQSVISKHVQALEDWTGVPLLARTTRRQNLTEAGRRFHARCLQILETLDDARRELHHPDDLVEGELTVSASVTFGRLHLVPRMADFHRRYPRLRLRLHFDDAYTDLPGEGVDVAFRLGETPDRRLQSRRIGSAVRMTLASREYVRAHGEPRHPAELVQHRCLIYSRLAEPRRWNYRAQDGETLTVDVDGPWSTSSSETLSQAVREGLGIAYTTEWNFFEELDRGSVVPLLRAYEPDPMPLHVVYATRRRPSLNVQAFVDHFAQSLAADPRIGRMIQADPLIR